MAKSKNTIRNKKRLHHQNPPTDAIRHKKKWIDLEIYRVPLNPNQAVLTCCSWDVKGWACQSNGRTYQCCGFGCSIGNAHPWAPSS